VAQGRSRTTPRGAHDGARRRPSPGRVALALTAALALAGCGGDDGIQPVTFDRPATAVDYDVVMIGAPTPEAEAILRQSLNLFRRQADGAASAAFLRRRAVDDVETARRVLRSFGYYEATAEIEVTPPPAPAVAAPGAPPPPPPRAQVTFAIDAGRPFTLAAHRLLLTDGGDAPAPPMDPATLGSPVGGVAAAEPIIAAEETAVVRLTNQGRPYARREGRDAVADMERAEIEVDSTISTGGLYRFGEVRFEGLRRVEADYLLTYVPWSPGAIFDARRLSAFQRDLTDTQLFSVVSARPPEEPPEGGEVPIVVTATEGPRRTVTAGARWNTDTGPALRTTFEHRNLFGANETVRLEALAGQEEQRFETRFRKPQFLRPGQALIAGVGFRNIETDAFDETAATAAAGVERELSRKWTVGGGALVELTETTEEGVSTTYLLAGPTGFVAYDGTDDALNPTQDARLRLDVTPLAGLSDEDDTPIFVAVDGVASAYLKLDRPGNHVLAFRGRLGSIVAAEVSDVPAGRRLYSGGGGSVRGYSERSIGPRNDRGDPSGGLSVVEAGAEFRSRFWGDFGGAAFVEAGAVSEDVAPTFDEDPQVAAGLGARYFSPVGPIRVDVGVPLNPRDDDDAFQVYLSIGQAF
jgi:translocation and assembly module TamA